MCFHIVSSASTKNQFSQQCSRLSSHLWQHIISDDDTGDTDNLCSNPKSWWTFGHSEKGKKLSVLTNKHMLNFLRTNLFIYFNEEKACVLASELSLLHLSCHSNFFMISLSITTKRETEACFFKTQPHDAIRWWCQGKKDEQVRPAHAWLKQACFVFFLLYRDSTYTEILGMLTSPLCCDTQTAHEVCGKFVDYFWKLRMHWMIMGTHSTLFSSCLFSFVLQFSSKKKNSLPSSLSNHPVALGL